jgi:CcmD family protein
MMACLRLFLALLVLVGACYHVPAAAQQPPERVEEMVPIDQLPPQDQLPAAPLLIAAYSFVVVVLFAYVISVGRRMSTVQKEIARLEADIRRSGRT